MSDPLSYNLGFGEASECSSTLLDWQGSPPPFLRGTLFRNGPGRFDRGLEQVQHWFDGLGLLHALTLGPEGVQYRSRFVRSRDFRQAEQTGRIDAPGFASDPCRRLFRRLASLFVVDATENTNIHVIRQADRYLALTELPVAIEFDPRTLRTLYEHRYRDALPAGATTAHPHQEGEWLYNQVLHYSARPTYRFYRQRGLQAREEFGRVPVHQVSYVHSFGLSQSFAVLTRCPFLVSPWTLLVRDRPFIENFSWQPEHGTGVDLCPRPGSGRRMQRRQAEPFFTFHHVHCQDHPDGSLSMDLVGYDDASIIEQLSLPSLAEGRGIAFGRFRRYRVPAAEAEPVVREWQSEHVLELPHRPRPTAGRSARYLYGVSALAGESLFYDRLIKLQVESDEAQFWWEPFHYPGEPIFVRDPSQSEEDGGVLLSLVLAGPEARSFLLVLDAQSMTELARAYLPGLAPHGFHGFWEDSEPRPQGESGA